MILCKYLLLRKTQSTAGKQQLVLHSGHSLYVCVRVMPPALTGYSFTSWRTKSEEMEKNEWTAESALKIASWLRMCKEVSNTSIQGPRSTATIHTQGSTFQANSLGCRFPQWVHAWWQGGHSMALEDSEGSSHPLAVKSLSLLWNVLPVSVFQQSCFYCGMQESLELSSSWAPGVQGYWKCKPLRAQKTKLLCFQWRKPFSQIAVILLGIM